MGGARATGPRSHGAPAHAHCPRRRLASRSQATATEGVTRTSVRKASNDGTVPASARGGARPASAAGARAGAASKSTSPPCVCTRASAGSGRPRQTRARRCTRHEQQTRGHDRLVVWCPTRRAASASPPPRVDRSLAVPPTAPPRHGKAAASTPEAALFPWTWRHAEQRTRRPNMDAAIVAIVHGRGARRPRGGTRRVPTPRRRQPRTAKRPPLRRPARQWCVGWSATGATRRPWVRAPQPRSRRWGGAAPPAATSRRTQAM